MASRLSILSRHVQRTSQVITRNVSGAASVLATRKRVNVLDSHISYFDTGKVGDEVVIFLHGNPTQAYLWRNVIPHVKATARCLAPDLIGMGQSGKINSSYKFRDHFRYLSAWIDGMDLPKKLNFVIHDWGSGLGFHWCNLHRDRVRSITYMEALVAPMRTWEDFPGESRQIFQALRSDAGDDMVLKKNMFVKLLLPSAVLRDLTEEEMSTYIAPFSEEGESRRPTLTWPREIPIIEVGPEDVCKIAMDYYTWLNESKTVPKLYVRADPGFFTTAIDVAVQGFPNNQVVTVKGHHFLQEDSPEEIGVAVRDFIKTIPK